MNRHSITTAARCPNCGTIGIRSYIAKTQNEVLKYGNSFSCPTCLFAEEAEASELWEEGRAAFIAAEGEWAVYVRDLGTNKSDTLRALHRLCNTSPGKLSSFTKHSRPVAQGILARAEYVAEQLQRAGAKIELVREQ